MEKHLLWNKGIFDSNYQIFEQGEIKYSMLFDTWRTQAKAITKSQSYLFKDDGFLNSATQIYNVRNELVGSIVFDLWNTKAKVTLSSGELYICDFTNAWHSKWVITNGSDKQITYDSSTSSGTAIANTDDELMLLTGFYVREHFTKLFLLIVAFILFIPMLTGRF